MRPLTTGGAPVPDEESPILAPLRDHPGFRRMLGEMRERNAQFARLYAQLTS